MKKVLLLLIILTATTALNLSWAQLGVGQQMQNNNFENWANESGNRQAPIGWHSLNSGTGTYSSLAAADFVSYSTSSYNAAAEKCVVLTCRSVSGVSGNGGLTTGRFNAGSMSASNSKNCTYTTTSSGYNQTMTAYPDSVYVWVKTILQNNQHEARFNIVIHNNTVSNGASYYAVYQDPTPTAGSGIFGGSESSNSVVNTTSAVNESKAVAKAFSNFNTGGAWVQKKIAFTYTYNNSTPSYILATFSTNKSAGVGSANNDQLYFDDVVLIYNTRLATLSVNNTPLNGFNADVTSYDYPTPIATCAGASFPTVSGTCQSGHASTQIMHDPSELEPYTIIRVKHLNQESTVYKDYQINFTVITAPNAPTVSVPNPDCAAAAHPVVLTASSDNATGYRWYTSANATDPVGTSASYTTPSISGSSTYYVSALNSYNCESSRTSATVTVNINPSAPIAGSTTSVCTGNTGVFTATLPAGDNLTCRWYETNNSTSVLGTGTSLQVDNLTQTTTRYASTYNTATGCESGRVPVTVNVTSAPAVPTGLVAGSNCGTGSVTLSATPAAGTSCQWFASETGGDVLATGNSFTTPTLSSSTTYYVASYITGCISSRVAVEATINPIPGNPSVSGNEPICAGSTLSMTATPGSNANAVKWYNESSQLVSENTQYSTPALNNSTSYNVKSYNSATGCISDGTTVDVVVNTIPASPSLSGDSRCGNGEVTLTVSNPVDGTTYTWYDANDAQVGTGISYSTTLASTTNFHVTATQNGCTGTSASVTATINTLPAAPEAQDVELCEAGTTQLSVSNPITGYSYKWYNSATGGEALHTSESYNANVSSSPSHFYVEAISTDGCTSSERTEVTVTISGNPTAPVVSDVYRCGIGSVTINVENPNNAYTYNWYNESEGGSAFRTGNSYTISNLQQDVTYYVSVSIGNCESDRTAVSAHVKTIPGAPDLSGDSRCGSGDVTLTVNNPNNDYTYIWYNSDDQEVNTGDTYTQNLGSTSTYYVTATLDGCTGSSASVTATINAIPALPTVTEGANCGAGTITLSATPGQNGNQIHWFAAAEGGEAIGTENSYTTPSISESTTYYAATYNSNTECISARQAVTATINSIPAAPVAEGTTLCGPGVATLTATPADNCICQWFNANNAPVTSGISTDTKTLTTSNLSSSTVYYVRSFNQETGCYSENTAVQVTVANVPGRATASSKSRCGAGDITLTATHGANANTCHWYAGNTLVHEGDTLEISNLERDTTFTCISYNSKTGCESNQSVNVTATINPIPGIPTVNGNTPICGNGSLQLTAVPGNNATICRWINGSETINSNIFNTGEINQSTDYAVQSYNANTQCTSENVTVSVVVNNLPDAPQITNDTQCMGSEVTLTATATEHTVARWYASAQDDNMLYEGSAYHPTNLTVGENKFYASLYDTLTQCSSATKTEAIATMIDAPAIPNVADTAHCGPADFTLSIINPNPNTTYNWYTEAIGGTATTGSTFTTGTLTATTHYYVSAAVSGYDCESGRKEVTVTINTVPANPTISGNEAICAGQSLTVSATSEAATGFVWSDGQNNSEGETFTTPVLEDNANYTVKAFNANCESEVVSFTVTVNPNPATPEVSSDTKCQNETIVMSATATTGNTCHWYASATSDEELSNGNSYSPTNLSVGTTTFFVSQRDDITNCESERTTVEAIVNPTYTVAYPEVACDSFQWNNETFTESGNYERTLHTQYGCDSVVTLQLTINNSVETEFSTIVCDSYQWNDSTYTTSGDYVQVFPTFKGCDSTVTLHLTVKKSSVGSDHIYLCSNQLPYNYNGIANVGSEGTYFLHTTNAEGCDSTINLTVTVNTQPSAAINLTPAARCGEGKVTLTANAGQNGTTCRWYASEDATEALYTGTPYTTDTLITTTTYYVSSYNEYDGHPCESGRQEIIATINTNPAEPIVADQVRCGNGTVEFEATIDENANTCHWYRTQNTTEILTSGLTYSVNVNTTSANGITYYVESYNGSTSCKSARIPVKATAHVIPSEPVFTDTDNCGPKQFSINAPTNGYYKWYDSEESASVLDIENNTTPMVDASRSYFISHAIDYTGISCESDRAELVLNIYPVYEPQDLYDTLCQGDTYTEHGLNETFNTAGAADRTLVTTSIHDCDSVVTLHLWVKENRSYSFDTTVCDSYVWNSETFTESEIITRHFTSSIECDSMVTVNLTINNSVETTFSATVCDSYQWNDSTYTTSGDYVQHFFTVNGCDSTVTLHLTINNSVETAFSATACDSYQWNDSTYTTSGDYIQVFPTSKGCDSTITLHLTVNYSNAAAISDEICSGTRYEANGFDTTFNTTSSTPVNYILVRHDLNQAGCDSTTTLTLTVNPIYNRDVTLTICETALPYTWNDITYPVGTASGDYEHTFSTHTVAGCDSIMTLHLTISHQYITPLTADICEGETYPFDNRVLNQSGIYYDTLQASNLCDSIIKLTLTVHELHTTNLDANICIGESYTEYDFNVTPETLGPNTYERIVQTEYGCDSSIILNLMVNDIYNIVEYDTICASELPYAWQGRQLYEESTYRAFYTSSKGCDSTIIMHLTVNPVYNQTESVAICESELPYTWRDTVFEVGTLGGEYVFNRSTVNGCDSTVTLTLTVNHTYYEEETATTCDNEEYVWEGHNVQIGLLEAGDHIIWDSLKTVNNCDSVYKLTLTVLPSYFHADTATTCENTAYVWEGHNVQIGLLEDNTYTIWDSLKTISNCDSVYQLTLIVTPTFYYEESATTCDNNEYVWEGHNVQIGLLAAGQHIIWDSLKTASNCDSVYKLTLTVNESKHSDIYQSICQGEYFEYDNELYEVTGNYDIAFQTALGCDSIVTLHLTVNPTYDTVINITICEGMLPYNFADTMFYESGNKDIELHTQYGCDSTIHVHLNVTPYTTASQTVTICDNELPYAFLDSTFSTAGIYNVIETSADGCNRITTLTLIVNPTYDTTVYAIACDSYTLDRGTYQRVLTESGIYTDTLMSINGCDSVVHLDLTINHSQDTLLTPVICKGESYTENGFNLNPENAGIVYDTLHLQCVGTGCDSTVYLELTVNPSYNIFFDTMVCQQFVWNNITYTASDTISHTYTLATGCDSTVTIGLIVNPSYYYTFDTTVCDLFEWNGQYYTQSEVLSHTYILNTGCDSIVTIDLTVNHSKDSLITNAICMGETYELNGFNIQTTEAGIMYDTLHLQCVGTGCDSTVYLELTVNPTYEHSFNAVVCDSFVWNNQTYTTSGIISHTYTLATGCDSTVTYNLTVNPSYSHTFDTTVCDLFVWNGQNYTESGTLTHTYTLNTGCDSTVTINLTVNQSVTEPVEVTICQVELPYTWRDTTFEEGTTTNTFVFNRNTVNGCDSTVILHLTVNPNNEYYDNPVTFCEGGSYNWNGQIITESGLYTDTVDNDFGCYDVYKVEVTVNPVYSFTEYDTVCYNELPIVWQGREIGQEGTHTADYHTMNGCDSIYTLVLTVNPTYFFSVTATTCDNEEYVWEGHDVEIGILQAGTYTIWDSLQTANQCDSVYMLTLTVTPTYHFDAETATVCDNEEYVWEGHDVQIGQRAAGTYTIIDSLATATFGCDSIHTLILTVTPTYNFQPETATVCDNEEYVWEGHNVQIGLLQAGEYTFHDSLTTDTFGCDSIYTLTLTVTPTYNFQPETATVCDNEEYVWEGHDVQIGQRAAGIYTIVDSLTTATFGCDSIHTLILTVTPTYNFQPETATVCDNEEYVWEGHNVQIGLLQAGEYTFHDSLATAGYGCDSIHTLILTVTPTYNFQPETATVCDNEEYVWAGHEHIQIGLLQAGEYTIWDSLSTSTYGCDSVYKLTLTVNPTAHSVETATACSNENVLIWHNQALTATGIYFDTLETILGCDSVCELHFTMLEPSSAVIADTTCANAIYQAYGFEFTPTQSGDTTMMRITENTVGCDSTITLNLYVKPVATFSFDTIVCGAFNWNNQWYTESNTYSQTFTAANGCDSIVTMNLTIDTPASDTIEVTACESYEWDGTTYTQSGVYNKVYPQSVGCDSTAVMILTINHSSEVTLYDTTCLANHYQEYGFDTLIMQMGTLNLQRIDINAAGCDSVINLMLTVHRSYLTIDSASTCDNDDFVWQGMHCDSTGIYVKSYPTIHGCDSAFVLFLTVNPSYEVDVTDSAIAGTPYHNHGLNFTPQTPGTLNIDVPRTAVNGCDSIVHVTLIVQDGNSINLHYLDNHIKLYPNPTEGAFTVNSTADIINELTIYDNNGKAVWQQQVNDYDAHVNVETLAPGIYFVRLRLPDNIVTKKLIVR